MFGRGRRIIVISMTVITLIGPHRVRLGVPLSLAFIVHGSQAVGCAVICVFFDRADQHAAHGRRVVSHRFVELVAYVVVLPMYSIARFQRHVTTVRRLGRRRRGRRRRRHRVCAIG